MPMKNWSFSLAMLVVYLATFHLWMHLSQSWIVVTGVTVSWVLYIVLLRMKRKGYFVNAFDFFAHFTVVLDILLEAILNLVHDHFGFYLCALAFSAVIGGYRYKKLRETHVS